MKGSSTKAAFPALGAATCLTLFLIATAPAFAIDRTVYFITAGVNRTTYGLSASAQSTCRLVITNPSTVHQQVVLSTSISSVDSWSSPANVAGTGPAVSGSGATSACGVSSCTVDLDAGQSETLTYSYTAYPTRVSGTTASGQSLRCAGSMLAKDTGATPGYVVANGLLVTFTESAAMHTDSNTGGQKTFGGIAIYSQIPIIINRGKPF